MGRLVRRARSERSVSMEVLGGSDRGIAVAHVSMGGSELGTGEPRRTGDLLESPETVLTKMCMDSSASLPWLLTLEMEAERRIVAAVLRCGVESVTTVMAMALAMTMTLGGGEAEIAEIAPAADESGSSSWYRVLGGGWYREGEGEDAAQKVGVCRSSSAGAVVKGWWWLSELLGAESRGSAVQVSGAWLEWVRVGAGSEAMEAMGEPKRGRLGRFL